MNDAQLQNVVFLWHEAADHILSCEGRFRGEADKQGRVASTAWVEDDPNRTGLKSRSAAASRHPCVLLFWAHAASMVSSVNRAGLPAIYPFTAFASADGLLTSGVDLVDLQRHRGLFDRILKRERSQRLPVQLPTKAIGAKRTLPKASRAVT
jgi:hypothetical protein